MPAPFEQNPNMPAAPPSSNSRKQGFQKAKVISGKDQQIAPKDDKPFSDMMKPKAPKSSNPPSVGRPRQPEPLEQMQPMQPMQPPMP